MIAGQPTPASTAEPAAVRLRDASVVFQPDVVGVQAVDLTIQHGQRVALVGPSGCGKTTLLRVIAGLQPLTSGTCERNAIASNTNGDRRSTTSFVFQQPALLPWRTVAQNVALPLSLGRRNNRQRPSEMEQRVADVLRDVDMTTAASRWPHQCSGGMKMRVSIARALVTSPSLLLLDEPFAALDDVLRNQLGGLVADLWRQKNFTMVLVTHHIAEAITMSETICVMHHGQIRETFDNPIAIRSHDGEGRDSKDVRRTPEFAAFYGEISDALVRAATMRPATKTDAAVPATVAPLP